MHPSQLCILFFLLELIFFFPSGSCFHEFFKPVLANHKQFLILNTPDNRDKICIGILSFCLHFQTSCPQPHTLNAGKLDTCVGSKITMLPSSTTQWLFPSVIKSRIHKVIQLCKITNFNILSAFPSAIFF